MADREPIDDEAYVVRCGAPPFDDGKRLFDKCTHHEGVYGFSVQSRSGYSIERLATSCPNGRIGVLRAAVLRRLRYDVVVTQGVGHHATVVVPENWTLADALVLANLFQDVKNPVPPRGRML